VFVKESVTVPANSEIIIEGTGKQAEYIDIGTYFSPYICVIHVTKIFNRMLFTQHKKKFNLSGKFSKFATLTGILSLKGSTRQRTTNI
jgi:hypothetical protein